MASGETKFNRLQFFIGNIGDLIGLGPRHTTPDNIEERIYSQQRQHFGGRSSGERRSSREEPHVRNSRGEESKGMRPRRERRRPNEEDNVAENHEVSSVDQGK